MVAYRGYELDLLSQLIFQVGAKQAWFARDFDPGLGLGPKRVTQPPVSDSQNSEAGLLGLNGPYWGPNMELSGLIACPGRGFCRRVSNSVLQPPGKKQFKLF